MAKTRRSAGRSPSVIHSCELPDTALLRRYAVQGGYVDCYTTFLPGVVSYPDYVTAFYTTWLFKLERLVLRWLVSRPSTDTDVCQLAAAERDTFAARRVEARNDNQLLMCDL